MACSAGVAEVGVGTDPDLGLLDRLISGCPVLGSMDLGLDRAHSFPEEEDPAVQCVDAGACVVKLG